MNKLPRLLLSAPGSGNGKTTVCCALMRALQKRGLRLSSFKCGPDYIDPMFHESVLSARGYNLDLFFSSPEEVRKQLLKGSADSDLAVLEGAMGYYDGISGKTDQASAWQTALETRTPVLLIVRPSGSSLTLAAQLKGMLEFRKPSMIEGLFLNDCKPSLFPMLKSLLEQELQIPVLGFLPHMPENSFESRHLGLITAAEITNLRDKIDRLAEQMEQSTDLDRILAIAEKAPALRENCSFSILPPKVRIAYARDAAFCFYYRENLELLKESGAQLVSFSPLSDPGLPLNTDALYLGGGYPELYAEKLSENISMRDSIREQIRNGMPVFAECGGYQYLQNHLQTAEGISFPMVGMIPAETYPTGKLSYFGYVTLTAEKDTILCSKGAKIRAHEFHYWNSTDVPASFLAEKPGSLRKWPAIYAEKNIFAGYPHLYFPSNSSFAVHLIEAAERYQHESNRTFQLT